MPVMFAFRGVVHNISTHMVSIGVVIWHDEEMSLIVRTRSNCLGYYSALDFKIPSSTCEIKNFSFHLCI